LTPELSSFAPGSVKWGIIFNLTRLNVKNPLNVKFQRQSIIDIRSNITGLNNNINQTSDYVSQILTIKPRFDPIMNSMELKYNATFDAIDPLINDAVNLVLNVISTQSILDCGWLGTFVNGTSGAVCGDILFSLGGTAITILAFMIVFAFATVVIFWSWMLHDKVKYYPDDDDDDWGDEGIIDA